MSLYEGRGTGGVIAVTISLIVLVLVIGGWIVSIVGQGNIQDGVTTIIDVIQRNAG